MSYVGTVIRGSHSLLLCLRGGTL